MGLVAIGTCPWDPKDAARFIAFVLELTMQTKPKSLTPNDADVVRWSLVLSARGLVNLRSDFRVVMVAYEEGLLSMRLLYEFMKLVSEGRFLQLIQSSCGQATDSDSRLFGLYNRSPVP
jgi:hypothetical protein